MNEITEKRLFTLLRLALWRRDEDTGIFDGITEAEWSEIYAVALAQGVLAIAFDGAMMLRKRCSPIWTTNPVGVQCRTHRKDIQAPNRYGIETHTVIRRQRNTDDDYEGNQRRPLLPRSVAPSVRRHRRISDGRLCQRQ